MRIEIICTGDEVLSGKTVNTNYSHMARRLQEVGLDVLWGTTVGDARESLVEAFRLASERADAVIVNGGLGPTVDDLSQEVAAQAAGVNLVLNERWLKTIESFYEARGRTMPPNNRKQAMLPEGSEFIDNPIGTACGFAINIGNARFMFTPGVPREIRLMLDEEIIPRLLTMRGGKSEVRLLRFHSFGLGESRVDNMLDGIEDLADGGEVKLGFQAHYPQLETKLFATGEDADELERRLAPVVSAVRERLGSYLLAEGDDTLEGNVIANLSIERASLAIAEVGTQGRVAGRMAAIDSNGTVFKRGALGMSVDALAKATDAELTSNEPSMESARVLADAVRQNSNTTHGLAVVIDTGAAEGWVRIGISRADDPTPIVREACIVGGPDRVRTGGVEMALDGLRRLLSGQSIDDPVDFEKTVAANN
ncbi:MAG: CinA family nicotinamide mononucleotide deamidase-related protein [Pseudomonadota bacterium]